MKVLDLSYTKIVVIELNDMVALHSRFGRNCRVRGLKGFIFRLEKIEKEIVRFPWSIIDQLCSSGLVVFYIRLCTLNDCLQDFIRRLKGCRNLQTFSLLGNTFSTDRENYIPNEIGEFPSLVELCISTPNVVVHGPIPASIGNLTTTLEFLTIGGLPGGFERHIPETIVKLTRLIILNLYEMNLQGDVPLGISRLTRLTHLDLSNNPKLKQPNLDAILPSFINLAEIYTNNNYWELTMSSFTVLNATLKVLVIGNDKPGINHIIVSPLSSLSRVSKLSLNHLSATGPFGNWVCDLTTAVVDLSAVGMGLEGHIPRCITRLTRLTHLDIDENELSGSLAPLQKLTTLIKLYAGGNNLNGTLAPLRDMKKLETLSVHNNVLKGSLESVKTMNKLERLSIEYNQFNSTIPNWISRLSKLDLFNANHNRFFGPIPTSLYQLQFLRALRLQSNLLTGTISPAVSRMQMITELNIGRNLFEGNLPLSITRLDQLQHFAADNANLTVAPNLSLLLQIRLKRLVQFDISGNRMSTGPIKTSFPPHVVRVKTNLSGINASKCANEGEMCHCFGAVYYGRRYIADTEEGKQERSFQETVDFNHYVANTSTMLACAQESFNGDPVYGHQKHCYCVEKAPPIKYPLVESFDDRGIDCRLVHPLGGHRAHSVHSCAGQCLVKSCATCVSFYCLSGGANGACVDTSDYTHPIYKNHTKGYYSWKDFCKKLFSNNGVFYGGKGDCNNRCQTCTEEDEALGVDQCVGFLYDVRDKSCYLYGGYRCLVNPRNKEYEYWWLDYSDWRVRIYLKRQYRLSTNKTTFIGSSLTGSCFNAAPGSNCNGWG